MSTARCAAGFEYFQHSHRYVFGRVDSFVRQRLRAILRKRSKRRGNAKGWDFHRWHNVCFAVQGLFSLAAAHVSACPYEGEPSTGEPCAGDPHARFGGRGDPDQWVLPAPTIVTVPRCRELLVPNPSSGLGRPETLSSTDAIPPNEFCPSSAPAARCGCERRNDGTEHRRTGARLNG